MRALIAMWTAVTLAMTCSSCSDSEHHDGVYGAQSARLGESLWVLGWNISTSNLRWDADYVLIDVDASPTDPAAPHAKPEDIRCGLYGALAYPMEATGVSSCDTAKNVVAKPLSAPAPDRLTGAVHLGPLKDRSAVLGVYAYSSRDRIPGTTAAYPAAFPVGMLPTNENDTGLVVKTSVSAWRADGTQLGQAAVGEPGVFTGNGYTLLGLDVDAIAAKYRDDSAIRHGPTMLLASPTLPGTGLSPACAAYEASVLILPEVSPDVLHVSVSLCARVGTHPAVWTTR